MNKVKSITFVALFTALIAVCGFISIPVPGTPIPIVLQNMMVVLVGLLLGPLMGTCSTLLFLLLGAVGLPIFSGGGGGIARFLGPTGGFLYGYLLATLVSGLIARKPKIDKKTPLWILIIASFLGYVVMYIPGVIHFMLTMNATFSKTLTLCVIPYIPLDLVKMVLCIAIAATLRQKCAKVLFESDDISEDESK